MGGVKRGRPVYPCIVHISWGGPTLMIYAGSKAVMFEDHPRFGPILLDKRTENPTDKQWGEKDPFWRAYELWVSQGKRTHPVGKLVWCDYERAKV